MEKIVNHTGKTTLFSSEVIQKLVPDFGIGSTPHLKKCSNYALVP